MILQATAEDFAAIMTFYDKVIDAVDQTDIDLRWVKGVHPSPKFIEKSIEDGGCLIMKKDESVIAAAVLNNDSVSGYSKVLWERTEKDGRIGILHVLAADPDMWGTGLAVKFTEDIVEFARTKDYAAIHMDVYHVNIPGRKLYPKAGFKLVEKAYLTYPTAGTEEFYMFEYVLH